MIGLLLLSFPALAAQDPAIEALPEIVQKSIRYHGWDRLPEADVALTLTSRSGSFDLVARPGDLFDYRVVDETRIGERTHRWRNDRIEVSVDGRPIELEDEEERRRARDFVSARVYFLFLPYPLRDPSVRVEDLGVESWGDRELHQVRVDFEPGTSTDADEAFRYWFDPESGRLEQFAYTFGGGMRFRRTIDHREVDGFGFYDQENYGIDQAGAGIDDLDAASAAELPLISTVRLVDIEVASRGSMELPD